MAYFPFFMDISAQEALVVGGGVTALRKIEKLLPFGVSLTVAAPEILPEIEKIDGLRLLHRPYSPDLTEGKFFVIAATNDRALNHEISTQCREKGIPVNVVDDIDACSFIFPALVTQGDLSIGISTGGASPSAAIHLKKQIQALVLENFDSLLAYLAPLREGIKSSFETEAQRAAFFTHFYAFCLENGWPQSDAVLYGELQKFKEAQR